jgi:hypothetical protein
MPTPEQPCPILRALAPQSRRSGASPPAATDFTGDFHAEGQIALDALAVTVQGLGLLAGQITPETGQALHAASTPAPYGRREATLLDTRIRDTGEIAAEALTLHWADAVLPALQAEVAQALGLQRLEARLHKLLVYGPGQFFKPHQDTEKHPGMVATLVLVWPSAHIGGELQVWHGKQQARFASQHLQASAIRWFAFYADCRHEVLPVTEGWRVVLTFDLVVPAGLAEPVPVPPPLLAALRAHFYPEDGARLTPWVFLLDHEYTEHGLRWALLKGEDRPRVAVLRAAAQALGLTVHLALAEIHEQWTATVAYRGRHGGGDGQPERDELVDEGMVLDFWVDADDQPLRRRAALPVALADSASLSDTDESFLVNEEYEGYMGNYGETLDYWYRRAALVIQTPLAAEASRFDTDFDAALADALALARGGRSDELAQRLHAAARSLDAQRHTRGRSLLDAYATLAAALPEPAQARWMCEGFDWAGFTPADAAALARLAGRWGAPWLQALVRAWAERAQAGHRNRWHLEREDCGAPWPKPLAAFIEAGQRAGLDGAVIDDMLGHCRAALAAADTLLAPQTPAVRHASLGRRLQALCGLVDALRLSPQADRHLAALLRHVTAQPGLYPARSLRPLLAALPQGPGAPPAVLALRAAVVQALRQALAEPALADDDHRLDGIEWTCRCADCSAVIGWATAAGAQTLTLALAEPRRQHLQSQLEAAAAPVSVATVKQGSPYKLVIRKPADLPARRRALRQAWRDDLAALESDADPHPTPSPPTQG